MWLAFVALLSFTIQATTSQNIPTPVTQQRQQHEHEILTQVTKTEWPSLRFTFKIKRSSMRIHGQSNFSVLAKPVLFFENKTNGIAGVRYDSVATFTEDKTIFNYTLIDGVAYVSRVSLNDGSSLAIGADAADIVPIGTIVSALNEATPMSNFSSSSSGIIECSSGNLFRVSVNDVDFGLCASGSLGFVMDGRDMEISVEYLMQQVNIVPPESAMTNHEMVTPPTPLTALAKSLLTGETIPQSTTARQLKAEFDFSFGLRGDSCSCKSTPRPCVFIHGLKLRKYEPDSSGRLPKYWGDIADHAPCCTTMKFTVLDTINVSWTDDTQQQKVCDEVLAVSETSEGTTISDTIVVTHSMGGLIMSGAIATGKCSLAASTTWVANGTPMKGSMVSDYFQDSCNDDTNIIAEKLVDWTGLCPASYGIRSLAYQGGKYSSPELDAAYSAAQEAYQTNTSALLCSKGFFGVLSPNAPSYWTLGTVVPHKSKENDGLVEFQSCALGIPESRFGDTYDS